MRTLLTPAFALALSAATIVPAAAEVTQKDIQVLGRALGFVTSGVGASSTIVIVYDPAVPASVQEAAAVQGFVGTGLKAGSRSLSARLAKLDELPGLTDVAALYLTSGLGPAAAKVGDAARAFRVPCGTTDLAQVQNGACTIYVTTAPKIEISVNKSVAAAEGVTFDDAFRLMIHEL